MNALPRSESIEIAGSPARRPARGRSSRPGESAAAPRTPARVRRRRPGRGPSRGSAPARAAPRPSTPSARPLRACRDPAPACSSGSRRAVASHAAIPPIPASSAPGSTTITSVPAAAARRRSRSTSASTAATPVALSLAPGTVAPRATSSESAAAAARIARAGASEPPRRRAPIAAIASSGSRENERVGPDPGAAPRQARVPHQARVGGVVVRDQHHVWRGARRARQPGHHVRPLPGREAVAATAGRARSSRARTTASASAAGEPAEGRRREVQGLDVPEASAGSETARPAPPARPPRAAARAHHSRRGALARARRAPLHRGQRLDVGAQAQPRCQSTGPALSRWLPSGRPSTF